MLGLKDLLSGDEVAPGAIRLPGVLIPSECQALCRLLADDPGEITVPYNETGTAKQPAPDFVNSRTSYGTEETRLLIQNRLHLCHPEITEFFGRDELEPNPELHFLSYETGGYIKPHKDVIPGSDAIEKIRERLVVFSIFLNDDFEGGRFMLAPPFPGPPRIVEAKPGDMVAFVSDLTHGVSPITKGTRYSVTGWYRSSVKEDD